MELDSGESDQPERLEINNGPKLGAKLSRFDAFALLVGHQIGSGIFAAPSQVHNHTPSPGASLLVWLFSGLIAWSGAASFAELGSIMPVNGGMQEYLHEIYGPFMAFLSSWVWIFAVKPPSMAMLSIIFSQYWIHALLPENLHSLILEKVLAVFMLISMIILNAMGTNTSRRLSAVFFYFKVSAIALLSLCGFLVLMDGLHLGPGNLSLDWKTKNWFSVKAKPDQIDWETANPWDYLGEMSAAITAGLWAFGGWDNANIVAGEIRNPSRNLPIAIHIALPTVILSYLVANISYYIIVPWSEIGLTDTIAVMAGKEVFGAPGGLIFAFLVSLSCIGSVFINVFTTSRLTAAVSIMGYLPGFLAQIGPPKYRHTKPNGIELETVMNGAGQNGSVDEIDLSNLSDTQQRAQRASIMYKTSDNQELWETPINAMIFNGVISCMFIAFGTLRHLVKFRAIADYFFYVVTVAGVLVLRYREPDMNRPYKTFTLLPLFFIAMGSFIVIRESISSPFSGAIFFIILALAGICHWAKNGINIGLWNRIKYNRLG